MSLELITKLREMTGAGIGDCNKALKETSNDLDKACQWLREKGMASAIKRAGKSAKQGVVYSYIHGNGVLGVLVEVNCETDFVAKTDDFQSLAKEVAMQIAAMSPLYVNRDAVPAEILEAEKSVYKAQLKEEGKPEKVWDKIIEGKIEKFYGTICLYDQLYMKDTTGKVTIKDLVNEKIGKIGENIVIKRFARFKLGEE
ncbi:translation elongation factor Ts [Endomicrobium proavitum]|uniref:Elongation factor Ts n=1 Tax=Endomicrobium proavitum TaxID=1408281 RepID=A0A0G3WH39_9BACT|nr:translation elongation factor Ts [Endomicrobium proavitum]AKL97648.1 translation elongation factor Ts [Endomicrobium proavitum]